MADNNQNPAQGQGGVTPESQADGANRTQVEDSIDELQSVFGDKNTFTKKSSVDREASRELDPDSIYLKLVYLKNELLDPAETGENVEDSIYRESYITIRFNCKKYRESREQISEVLREIARERKGAEPDDMEALGVPEAIGFGAYFSPRHTEGIDLKGAEWVQTKFGPKSYISFRRKMDLRRLLYALADSNELKMMMCTVWEINMCARGKKMQMNFVKEDRSNRLSFRSSASYGGEFYRHGARLGYPCGERNASLYERTAEFMYPLELSRSDLSTKMDYHSTVTVLNPKEQERVLDLFEGSIIYSADDLMRIGLFYYLQDEENADALGVRIVPWRVIECEQTEEGLELIGYAYTDLGAACYGGKNPEIISVACNEEEFKKLLSERFDEATISRCMGLTAQSREVQIVAIKEAVSYLAKPEFSLDQLELKNASPVGDDSISIMLASDSELLMDLCAPEEQSLKTDFPVMGPSSTALFRFSSEHYGIAEIDPVKEHIIIERDNAAYDYSIELLEKYGMDTQDLKNILQSMRESTQGLVPGKEYVEKVRASDYPGKARTICSQIDIFVNRECAASRDLKNEAFVVKDPLWQEISKLLYKGDTVPDKNLVTDVYYAYKRYIETGEITQFSIVGDPGCGKSTLAEGLADVFINGAGKYRKADPNPNPIHIITPNDMKSPYRNDANHYIAMAMQQIVENGQVLFIDEAYELLQADGGNAGKDTVITLLKIMDGQQKSIFSEADKNRKEINVSWDKTPFLWMGGYENEMREMVCRNEGLYRRLKFLLIDTPTINALYDSFCNQVKKAIPNLFSTMDGTVSREVKDYFRWGTGKDNVRYFANYAGVVKLVADLDIRIDDSDTPLAMIAKLRQVIKRSKKEIRKQYKASVALKNKDNRSSQGTLSFETQKDIQDNFSVVRGNVNALESMEEIKEMLINADDYHDIGISVPKGALMMGQPGTGKTLIARALAGEIQKEISANPNCELKVAFLAVAATDFRSPQDISVLFSEADNYDICIIFIDEIDAIGKQRNMDKAKPDLLIQLMKEMDGFDVRGGLFVLAATNNPEVLDDALKRPGRFDRMIEVTLPDEAERADIIEFYLKKLYMPWTKDKDAVADVAAKLAHLTPGESPAALRNLINETAILNRKVNNFFEVYERSMERFTNLGLPTGPIEKRLKELCFHRIRPDVKEGTLAERYMVDNTAEAFFADLRETREILDMGHVRTDRETEFKIAENDIRTTAVTLHEVGHALAGYWSGIKTIDFITSIPRGDAAGYVRHSVDSDMITKAQFIARIKCSLGGRAAEEVFYGADNISTGASSDIQSATRVAMDMIGRLGMDEEFGMFGAMRRGAMYLSGGNGYNCSEETRGDLDDKAQSLLVRLYREVVDEMTARKDEVEYMARLVFERETMSGEDFFSAYEEYMKGKNA